MVQEVVRGFLPGLMVGLLVGGSGVYAALERPWKGQGVVAAEPGADAGPSAKVGKKPGKRKRRGRRRAASVIEVAPLTAADRALLWKGDMVKLPTRSVDMTEASDGRPLNGDEINEVIRSQSSAVVDCIATATGSAPLTSAVTIKMLIGPSGAPQKVRVRAASYLMKQGLLGCVKNAARSLQFPATGGHTVVTAPYELN